MSCCFFTVYKISCYTTSNISLPNKRHQVFNLNIISSCIYAWRLFVRTSILFFFFLMNDTFRRLSQWVCVICAFHAAPSISWLLIWGRIKEGLGPAFEGRSLKRKEKHKWKEKKWDTNTPVGSEGGHVWPTQEFCYAFLLTCSGNVPEAVMLPTSILGDAPGKGPTGARGWGKAEAEEGESERKDLGIAGRSAANVAAF